MGKVFDRIDDPLRRFIAKQKMFFVATAPLAAGGHVNLSPKGLDTLAVIDDRTLAYLDYAGSGAETIAHLRENGRIVVMLCAFQGAPKIVRFHGTGVAVTFDQPEFSGLAAHFPRLAVGVRAIIRIDCTRISDSCGYGVPLMAFEGERSALDDWATNKGPDGIRSYVAKNNSESLDGLPALAPDQVAAISHPSSVKSEIHER